MEVDRDADDRDADRDAGSSLRMTALLVTSVCQSPHWQAHTSFQFFISLCEETVTTRTFKGVLALSGKLPPLWRSGGRAQLSVGNPPLILEQIKCGLCSCYDQHPGCKGVSLSPQHSQVNPRGQTDWKTSGFLHAWTNGPTLCFLFLFHVCGSFNQKRYHSLT